MSSIHNDDESISERLLREWEAASARYRHPLPLSPNILSERSGGEYANEVGYSVTVSQGSVNVWVWGSGNVAAQASAHRGGSGGSSLNYAAYYTHENMTVQMALAAEDCGSPGCTHDLAVPVKLLLTEELVAWLCELCLAQLPADWEPLSSPPTEHVRNILNQYGERVAYWTTQTGEWIIVRV
jgi:hypothetical protein